MKRREIKTGNDEANDPDMDSVAMRLRRQGTGAERPVLAGMIAAYTDKAQKELKNQEKVMLMQTTGHLWTKEEVEATTDLQRELNNYLTRSARSSATRRRFTASTTKCRG